MIVSLHHPISVGSPAGLSGEFVIGNAGEVSPGQGKVDEEGLCGVGLILNVGNSPVHALLIHNSQRIGVQRHHHL